MLPSLSRRAGSDPGFHHRLAAQTYRFLQQHPRVEHWAACFVPITVVLELEWVLRGAYKLPRETDVAH